ncbi:MAG: helix-turn-helix domain-containing protein [Acidimicrobiia bacterium]|jgi:AcrR family transcriptional regulator
MTNARRIGAPDSRTRAQLLDAAEQLMLEEGYAAVTSRRLAAKAGLKHQLVHYYFRTMDDLFLEVFRRRAEDGLERFQRALASDRSLRTIWTVTSDPQGAAFNIEFVALANHRKAIRSEIARSAERFRAMQLDAMTSILAERGIAEDVCPPIVALVALTGIAQVMALEDALGVTAGHDETLTFVEQYIDTVGANPARTVRRTPRRNARADVSMTE